MSYALTSGPVKALLAIRICDLTNEPADAPTIAYWTRTTPGHATEKCHDLAHMGYVERVPPSPETVGKGGRQTWRLTPAGLRKAKELAEIAEARRRTGVDE